MIITDSGKDQTGKNIITSHYKRIEYSSPCDTGHHYVLAFFVYSENKRLLEVKRKIIEYMWPWELMTI